MSGPLIQNFSVTAGDPVRVNIDVDPDSGVELVPGTQIFWTMFAQSYAVPDRDTVVIRKTLDHGIEIDNPDTLLFHVDLEATDTVDLTPKNYYHETVIVSVAGDKLTVNCGEVTVLYTATRDLSF